MRGATGGCISVVSEGQEERKREWEIKAGQPHNDGSREKAPPHLLLMLAPSPPLSSTQCTRFAGDFATRELRVMGRFHIEEDGGVD